MMTQLGPGPEADTIARSRILELIYYIQSTQEP